MVLVNRRKGGATAEKKEGKKPNAGLNDGEGMVLCGKKKKDLSDQS